MKRLLVILALLLVFSTGCIMDEKVIEIVVSGETCVEFAENEDSEDFSTVTVVDYADEIDGILEEHGLDRSRIKEAYVVEASYEVTDFSHDHDWHISGQIEVARTDVSAGPFVLIDYTDQSVEDALGTAIAASLNSDGVELLNDALEDYVSGGSPVISFEVVNGNVDPDPSDSDRLVFTWQACVKVHIVVVENIEVPDPF